LTRNLAQALHGVHNRRARANANHETILHAIFVHARARRSLFSCRERVAHLFFFLVVGEPFDVWWLNITPAAGQRARAFKS